MALVKGTNCGFVSAAPVDDPNGTGAAVDGYSFALRDTSPAGTNNVTKMGLYQSSAVNGVAAYELGIYSHDAVNDLPNALVSKSTGSSTAANTAGWYLYSGLSIEITAATTYWLAESLEDVVSANNFDYTALEGERYSWKSATPNLPDPSWGASSGTSTRLFGIYALYEAAAGGAIKLDRARPIGIYRGMYKQMWGNF